MTVTKHTEAINCTSNDDPELPARLINLGIALSNRFERLGLLEDLHRAIECFEQGVDSTQKDHPSRAAHLNNLCAGLIRRFEREGALADAEMAVEKCSEAVKAAPWSPPLIERCF